MGENTKLKIADHQVWRRLAAAQEWTCAGCGRKLDAGASAVVYAAPPEGGPAE